MKTENNISKSIFNISLIPIGKCDNKACKKDLYENGMYKHRIGAIYTLCLDCSNILTTPSKKQKR